ncbi:hypothetical protein [Deefgea piscis]|uniref:hypothetical protein n=1 Tax=Deefgea piscis TaxID=2739061 RepID=UPI001C817EAA|nr:hypothetical protein [Deefgea piscis]QZA80205.1 hypothetical protein K4H25_11745 [Deefgea piscis]
MFVLRPEHFAGCIGPLSNGFAVAKIIDPFCHDIEHEVHIKVAPVSSRAHIHCWLRWLLAGGLGIPQPGEAWFMVIDADDAATLHPDKTWITGKLYVAIAFSAPSGGEAPPVRYDDIPISQLDDIKRWPAIYDLIALDLWGARSASQYANWWELSRGQYLHFDGSDWLGGEYCTDYHSLLCKHQSLAELIVTDDITRARVQRAAKRHRLALSSASPEIIKWVTLVVNEDVGHDIYDTLQSRINLRGTAYAFN